MKNYMLLICTFCIAIVMGLSSCEGEDGTAGPIGPIGPQGPAGPQGEGTQNCVMCHGSSQLITAKTYQWEHSVHATGGLFVLLGLPCVGSWAAFGSSMRRYLQDPLKLRIFNSTMALALVISLYPMLMN